MQPASESGLYCSIAISEFLYKASIMMKEAQSLKSG